MQDQALYNLIHSIVKDMGYIALESSLQHSKNKHTLKVVIYHSEHSVGSDDCADVAEVLSRRLDIDDPIKDRYDLLVESPGLEREIRSCAEYPYFVGKEFKIFPQKPLDREIFFIGTLQECTKDACVFLVGNSQHRLSFSEIRKARLHCDFQKLLKKKK